MRMASCVWHPSCVCMHPLPAYPACNIFPHIFHNHSAVFLQLCSPYPPRHFNTTHSHSPCNQPRTSSCATWTTMMNHPNVLQNSTTMAPFVNICNSKTTSCRSNLPNNAKSQGSSPTSIHRCLLGSASTSTDTLPHPTRYPPLWMMAQILCLHTRGWSQRLYKHEQYPHTGAQTAHGVVWGSL